MAQSFLPDYTAEMDPVADDSFARQRISVDDYYRMSEVGLLFGSGGLCAPTDGRYADATVHDGGLIGPGLLPDAAIDLSQVLGLLA